MTRSWCSTLWWTSVTWLSRAPFWSFGSLWQFWRSPTCTCRSLLPARWIAQPLTALELAFHLWLFCSTRPSHKRSHLTRDVRFQWSTPITVPLFHGLTPVLARPRRRYHGNLQLRQCRPPLTHDASYYEALSSADGTTWHDADPCSHLMQAELDSVQSSMLSWQLPAEGERQHGSTMPFLLRRKGPYFFDCEPSSPVASATSELATRTLPRVNITKVCPASLRFLDVFYWQSTTLDQETLAWTRHGLAGYVATTSLLREMGLDVSTETHRVLRHVTG